MNENETLTQTEDDAIMPDGYGDDYEDIFAPDGTETSDGAADAQEPDDLNALFGIEGEEDLLSALAAEGTTPEQTSGNTPQVSENNAEKAPTTEQTTPSSAKLRFKASIDHNDQDIELDESELPTIYQKAYATDRAQTRLSEANDKLKQYEAREARLSAVAKNRGFDSADDMINATLEDIISELTEGGTPDAIARDYVERLIGGADKKPTDGNKSTEASNSPEQTDLNLPIGQPQQRDYKAEVNELMAVHGELRGKEIPQEVINAAIGGQRLAIAYEQYLNKQSRAQADKLQRDNDVLRQNAAAASRAPVRGVRGGSVSTAPTDFFTKGFDDDEY